MTALKVGVQSEVMEPTRTDPNRSKRQARYAEAVFLIVFTLWILGCIASAVHGAVTGMEGIIP